MFLQENECIFSKGEYDIGRTPFVECRIDNGEHRPIRRPLRRHPFKHLEAIDKQVAKMREHRIIEPTASPAQATLFSFERRMDLFGSALTISN